MSHLRSADDTTWMARGACVGMDPDSFFPEVGDKPRAVRRVCDGCEVREACLEYAILNGIEDGIWGGTTERQRRKILRLYRRNHPAPHPCPEPGCGATFKTFPTAMSHYHRVHPSTDRLTCKSCGVVLGSRQALRNHQRDEHAVA